MTPPQPLTRRQLVEALRDVCELDDPVVVSAVRSDVGWEVLHVRAAVVQTHAGPRHVAALEMGRDPRTLEPAGES